MGWERLLRSSDVSGEVEGPKTVKSCQVLMESDDFTSMEGRVRVAHWKRQPLLTAEIAGSSPGIVGKNIVGFVTRLYFGTESQ